MDTIAKEDKDVLLIQISGIITKLEIQIYVENNWQEKV